MKKQSKKKSDEKPNNEPSNWQFLLEHFLTIKERDAINAFNSLGMEKACLELNISRDRCSRLLKSGLKKLSVHFTMYESIKQKAKIHLFTKNQFLVVPLEDIGFSTRTYHLLKGADLNTISQVLKLGKNDLYRIRGFGNKAMVELKSILRYKKCLDLLE